MTHQLSLGGQTKFSTIPGHLIDDGPTTLPLAEAKGLAKLNRVSHGVAAATSSRSSASDAAPELAEASPSPSVSSAQNDDNLSVSGYPPTPQEPADKPSSASPAMTEVSLTLSIKTPSDTNATIDCTAKAISATMKQTVNVSAPTAKEPQAAKAESPEAQSGAAGCPVKEHTQQTRTATSADDTNVKEAATITTDHPVDAPGAASTDDAAQGDLSRFRGGVWSDEEHRLFLQGLEKHGKGFWRAISREFVKTRSPTQVASHAQKHFLRISGAPGSKPSKGAHSSGNVARHGKLPGTKRTSSSRQSAKAQEDALIIDSSFKLPPKLVLDKENQKKRPRSSIKLSGGAVGTGSQPHTNFPTPPTVWSNAHGPFPQAGQQHSAQVVPSIDEQTSNMASLYPPFPWAHLHQHLPNAARLPASSKAHTISSTSRGSSGASASQGQGSGPVKTPKPSSMPQAPSPPSGGLRAPIPGPPLGHMGYPFPPPDATLPLTTPAAHPPQRNEPVHPFHYWNEYWHNYRSGIFFPQPMKGNRDSSIPISSGPPATYTETRQGPEEFYDEWLRYQHHVAHMYPFPKMAASGTQHRTVSSSSDLASKGTTSKSTETKDGPEPPEASARAVAGEAIRVQPEVQPPEKPKEEPGMKAVKRSPKSAFSPLEVSH
mmetsp:Transcript_12154/g.44353  ORF Transcript_12154/g.44353 Transcript_12154/m.44353 type:complete len:657 (+) Transcript_12154:261-2231(+)